MKSVLLLSGGLDSAALGWWLRPEFSLMIAYGQLAEVAEEHAAGQVAEALRSRHSVIRLDLRQTGAGCMLGKPDSSALPHAPSPEWWPFRNQLLLTLAAAHAVKVGAESVMIGTVATDALHADGKPNFLRTIDELISSQEGGIRVLAPASTLSTSELVAKSQLPKDVLGWTHSCHVGNFPCGVCRGCMKHLEVRRALSR